MQGVLGPSRRANKEQWGQITTGRVVSLPLVSLRQ